MAKGRISPPEEWTAQKIIEMIQEGSLPPWTRSWSISPEREPKNLERPTKAYSGLNFMLLQMVVEIYDNPFFITPKQLWKLGGKAKEGEKTYPVFFYAPVTKEGEDRKIWICRGYRVYNVAQTTGIEDKIPPIEKPETFEHDTIQECEKIIESFQNCPKIENVGQKACYYPKLDTIKIPNRSRFKTAEQYYATLFHEIAHSTGHHSRLNRESLQQTNFGDHKYSEEELVAEMTAAMLCGKAGISSVVIRNQASYIKHWLEKLNPQMLVHATRAAKKAYSYILAEHSVEEAA